MSRNNEIRDRPADEFRAISDLNLPDLRQRALAILTDDGARPKELADQYAAIAPLELVPQTPLEIRILWDTARNLYVYAWHVWRFYPIAAMQAFATLEYALRARLGHLNAARPPTLRRLIDEAITKKVLRRDAAAWYQHLSNAVPKLRNTYAHGSSQLCPPTDASVFRVCRDLINEIFETAVRPPD
jgi:hypothetical protein